MIGNATSEIVLTEYEIDQLYDNMVDQNDEELSIEINGKIYDNYADLVELEKEQRVDLITNLMNEVDNMEDIIEENEEFFEMEYEDRDDELQVMFNSMDD